MNKNEDEKIEKLAETINVLLSEAEKMLKIDEAIKLDNLQKDEKISLLEAERDQLKEGLNEAMELLERSVPFANCYSGMWGADKMQKRYENLKNKYEGKKIYEKINLPR